MNNLNNVFVPRLVVSVLLSTLLLVTACASSSEQVVEVPITVEVPMEVVVEVTREVLRPTETGVVSIALSGIVSEQDAAISGMAWYNDYLILMPQYPDYAVEDGDGFLFAIAREDLLAYLLARRNAVDIEPIQIPFIAPGLQDKIAGFEGYEAIAFIDDTAYLTIESEVGETGIMGYLVKGSMAPDLSGLSVDTDTYVEIPSQTTVINITEEAILVLDNKRIATIHEANGVGVNPEPMVHIFDTDLNPLNMVPMTNIEYRITDATTLDANGRFWAINYFYPGDEDLLPDSDPIADMYGQGITHANNGGVERLVQFQYSDKGITLTDAPPIQLALLDNGDLRNWAGLARMGDLGFLIVTDKWPETMLSFIPATP